MTDAVVYTGLPLPSTFPPAQPLRLKPVCVSGLALFVYNLQAIIPKFEKIILYCKEVYLAEQSEK